MCSFCDWEPSSSSSSSSSGYSRNELWGDCSSSASSSSFCKVGLGFRTCAAFAIGSPHPRPPPLVQLCRERIGDLRSFRCWEPTPPPTLTCAAVLTENWRLVQCLRLGTRTHTHLCNCVARELAACAAFAIGNPHTHKWVSVPAPRRIQIRTMCIVRAHAGKPASDKPATGQLCGDGGRDTRTHEMSGRLTGFLSTP